LGHVALLIPVFLLALVWKIKRRAVLLTLIFLCALPRPAHADCTSPSKIAGTINWDSTKGYVEYCDGTTWHDTSNGTTANACSVAGKVIYSSGIYYYCNNSLVYVSMQGAYLGSCSGTAAGLITWDGTLSKVKFCDGTRWWSTIKTCQSVLTTTGAGTYSVPADWNSSDNIVEAIGGGSSGGTSASLSCSGGGGGAYGAQTNVSLTPSSSVAYSVGLGSRGTRKAGLPTYFCNSTSNCTTEAGTAVVVAADGETNLSGCSTSTGDLGGLASNGKGSTTYNGGNGNIPGATGGGGGGAAGPSGAGNSASTTNSGTTGNTGDNGNAPADGSICSYWPHVTACVGGGGDGGSNGLNGVSYGAGGGGAAAHGTAGTGANGIIIVTYSCG
jgi:hypothetical protein